MADEIKETVVTEYVYHPVDVTLFNILLPLWSLGQIQEGVRILSLESFSVIFPRTTVSEGPTNLLSFMESIDSNG